MSEQDPSVTAIVTAIESAAPGRWGAWLSDTGWWWAARTEALTARERSFGCVPYLQADNPHELAEWIREQDRLCEHHAGQSEPVAVVHLPSPDRNLVTAELSLGNLRVCSPRESPEIPAHVWGFAGKWWQVRPVYLYLSYEIRAENKI
jgi:hypothetical protein